MDGHWGLQASNVDRKIGWLNAEGLYPSQSSRHLVDGYAMTNGWAVWKFSRWFLLLD